MTVQMPSIGVISALMFGFSMGVFAMRWHPQHIDLTVAIDPDQLLFVQVRNGPKRSCYKQNAKFSEMQELAVKLRFGDCYEEL